MPVINYASRLKAAAIHLGSSITVALLCATLVFVLWYPPPFATLAGGVGLFTLITSVDVVIGPVITLAIFDVRKARRSLQKDMAIIILLQLAALGYGLHTMFVARPVAMVLEGDRFRVVSVVDVFAPELPQAPPELRHLPLDGPRWLHVIAPTEGDAKFDAIARALSGYDVGTRPKFWRAWDEAARRELKQNAMTPERFLTQQPKTQPALAAAIARSRLPAEAVGIVPIISRHVESVAIVDRRSGEVVDYAVLN